MFCNIVLTWIILLPTIWAISISSHLATKTVVLCSTTYGSSSVASLPTSTLSLFHTTELFPVILHNSTTLTTTITPKPFSTLFSVLTTKTKYVSSAAVNGTFYITSTKFGTSTDWKHETKTRTSTVYRYFTSRSTYWIAEPSGWVGVRNSTSEPAGKEKRELAHPHAARASTKISSNKKPKLVRPTEGVFAAGVECVQQVQLHTTEVLLLTETKLATVTLRPETVFSNRTVYGTITSTVLLLPSSSLVRRMNVAAWFTSHAAFPHASTSAAASTLTANSTSISATSNSTYAPSTFNSTSTTSSSTTTPSPPPLPTGPNGLATNLTTITKTPYTITFTHTEYKSSILTLTRHATTTLTSHSACATPHLLSQNSRNLRVNGFSALEGGGLEKVQTEGAGECCEICMQREGCGWGVWEAEGREKGACYLILVDIEGVEKDMEGKEGEREGSWGKQDVQGYFGYKTGNGEVRYVVSNGLCGRLLEA
ncbi:hypothetical protein AUEXF2481DRAFT_25180 [Aureobasidium subglaciale EXF-2481]|uniref:Apple domain-containing protein n=1 Tax=Aureobasidium subglaciale (strain EXF-2481) TaxID=1043005 RepID=A0A074ZRJ4_AURSE|nr:uncharacterized protein AUEXF2481DRAFT_25180 [Aureobasidium subglaciale EXF-2481]KER00902.1 hypothetical protein AUEXF2481DRAFT_25180 [Aureobasidium subglaciale EXF-2481]